MFIKNRTAIMLIGTSLYLALNVFAEQTSGPRVLTASEVVSPGIAYFEDRAPAHPLAIRLTGAAAAAIRIADREFIKDSGKGGWNSSLLNYEVLVRSGHDQSAVTFVPKLDIAQRVNAPSWPECTYYIDNVTSIVIRSRIGN